MTKNREIKFRVWDIKNKIWSRWVRENSLAPNIDLAADDNFVYQQYTGLKDKNGIEIYEGDLLTIPGWPTLTGFPIEWSEGQYDEAGWTGFSINSDDIREQKYIIIGNIYENPELLK